LSCGRGARWEIVSVRMLQRNVLGYLHTRGGPLLRSIAAFALVALLVASCTVTRELDDLTAGCPEGMKFCGQECVANDDPSFGCALDSCDPCPEHTNASRLSCSNGECVVSRCESGSKLCAGECRRLDLPEFGCNRPGCEPCYFDHTTGYGCNAFGSCEVTDCADDYADCNKTSSDGCEVFLQEDLNFCGYCSTDCEDLAAPHAEIYCAAGACVIRVCEVNYKNCDNIVKNGCERNLKTDHENCGACGRKCTADQTCTNGVCEP
jgi:hypothetical protein